MKVAQYPGSDQDTSLPVTAGPTHQEMRPAGDHSSAVSTSVDGDAFPPPPPAQLLNPQDVTGADSDDDFPLPPPPDQELTMLQTRSAEPANRHPGLLHSTSVRLPERGSVLMRPGPPVAAKQYRMTVTEHQQSSSHATAAAVDKSSSSDAGLLSQIQRGVSLRRTVSNDRSAPRIAGKR